MKSIIAFLIMVAVCNQIAIACGVSFWVPFLTAPLLIIIPGMIYILFRYATKA